jgi:hypothetical protein
MGEGVEQPCKSLATSSHFLHPFLEKFLDFASTPRVESAPVIIPRAVIILCSTRYFSNLLSPDRCEFTSVIEVSLVNTVWLEMLTCFP